MKLEVRYPTFVQYGFDAYTHYKMKYQWHMKTVNLLYKEILKLNVPLNCEIHFIYNISFLSSAMRALFSIFPLSTKLLRNMSKMFFYKIIMCWCEINNLLMMGITVQWRNLPLLAIRTRELTPTICQLRRKIRSYCTSRYVTLLVSRLIIEAILKTSWLGGWVFHRWLKSHI